MRRIDLGRHSSGDLEQSRSKCDIVNNILDVISDREDNGNSDGDRGRKKMIRRCQQEDEKEEGAGESIGRGFRSGGHTKKWGEEDVL